VKRLLWAGALTAAIVSGVEQTAAAPSFTTIYAFAGGSDGAYPAVSLLMGKNGVLYGTSEGSDTSNDFGTVFRLKPPKGGHGSWVKDTLYSFAGGRDGAYPWTTLIFDDDGSGALIGTTAGFDTGNDFGTVFRLKPRRTLPWREQIVHRFAGASDSGYPYDGLVQDSSTHIVYGTAYGTSDTSDFGAIFGYRPPLGSHDGKWSKALHYLFTGAAHNGAFPAAGLVQGPGGVYYGTTLGGGDPNSNCTSNGEPGCGTIFALRPGGSVQFLHDFAGGGNGALPLYGDLLLDASGHLYGTTSAGSPNNCSVPVSCGTVYAFAAPSANTHTFSVIAGFTGDKGNGAQPHAGIIFGLHGELYGSTYHGGSGNCTDGCGVVFKLTPDGGIWTLSIVHDFSGGADGANPYGLIIDNKGVLYGDAVKGGANGLGTVFKIQNP
jgi:uncharacterized repeat protein (TIGR03803 family)